ncbi:MAG: O-antigen ligase family protein [Candidatus Magasanikbacteria bacterium]|nr:O-antigen ligase family protein [Candidatus Magasanikbacteria bacterium]
MSVHKPLITFLSIITIGVILNPFFGIDVLLIGIALLVVGHVFLQEKLLFAFLIARPILDIWRDVHVVQLQNIDINMNAALTGLFLVWAVYMLLQHAQSLKEIPGSILGSLVALCMAVSFFWSVSPVSTLIETMKFVSVFVCFLLGFVSIQKKKFTFQELAIATLAAAVIPLLLGLFQVFFQAGITTFDIRGRIFGTFAHPNIFAFFILSLIMIYFHYASVKKEALFVEHPTLTYVGYGVLFFLLLQTYTRAAWVGCVVFLLIMGALQFRRLLGFVLVGGMAGYVLLFPINAFIEYITDYSLESIQVVSRITSRNEDADSLLWRQELFQETIPLITARPLLGYGYGTFPLVWENSRNATHLFDDSAEAHNDYLRLGLEIGLVGLGLYILFLLFLFSRVMHIIWHKQKEKNDVLFLAAWIGVFLVISISDNMLHHTPIMWLTWSWWGALFASKYEYLPKGFLG